MLSARADYDPLFAAPRIGHHIRKRGGCQPHHAICSAIIKAQLIPHMQIGTAKNHIWHIAANFPCFGRLHDMGFGAMQHFGRVIQIQQRNAVALNVRRAITVIEQQPTMLGLDRHAVGPDALAIPIVGCVTHCTR